MKKIEEIYGKDYTFIDVRSPAEFAEDHIPGAINIPLFDNDERAIVGTLYKQDSREAAIDKGLEIVSQKLPKMIKEYKNHKGKLCVYCWRGGMRSRSVVSLLKSLKYNVVQLERGYKDYRRFVREQLKEIIIPHLVVLYGLTGSGKTEMLLQLDNAIDLEGLAQHRGSVFGNINLKPRSQKMFESLLLRKILDLRDESFLFIEGESRKIGKVLIPDSVWKAMAKGTKVKVLSPFEERVDRLYKEYCDNLDRDLIKQKIGSIENYLGQKKAKELKNLLDKDVKEVIRIILKDYYDQLYKHTIDSKTYLVDIQSIEDLKNFDISLITAQKS